MVKDGGITVLEFAEMLWPREKKPTGFALPPEQPPKGEKRKQRSCREMWAAGRKERSKGKRSTRRGRKNQ